MAVVDETRYGCQSQTATLRRVLVRAPRPEDCRRWREFGWRAEPDPHAIAAEHEAFAAELAEFGAEVVYAEEPLPGALDAIYAYDPALVADEGAILLCPGKELRRGEPDALGRDLERAGVPTAARLEAPALAERGVHTVEVPDEEYGSLGCNVLALGPRVALALDGNPETRRRLERAGVDVSVYKGDELSLKGDGGPTCLTRPLLRA